MLLTAPTSIWLRFQSAFFETTAEGGTKPTKPQSHLSGSYSPEDFVLTLVASQWNQGVSQF